MDDFVIDASIDLMTSSFYSDFVNKNKSKDWRLGRETGKVVVMKTGIRSLLKNEDWWAVWFGFTIIGVALARVS